MTYLSWLSFICLQQLKQLAIIFFFSETQSVPLHWILLPPLILYLLPTFLIKWTFYSYSFTRIALLEALKNVVFLPNPLEVFSISSTLLIYLIPLTSSYILKLLPFLGFSGLKEAPGFPYLDYSRKVWPPWAVVSRKVDLLWVTLRPAASCFSFGSLLPSLRERERFFILKPQCLRSSAN